MKFNLLGTCGLIAGMAVLAGCATTPEEEEVPVVEEVQPVEPVVEVDPMVAATEILENEVGHRVFFGFDQYNLTSEAQTTLRRQANFLMAPENMDIRVRVAGHADERGTREYNLALGKRRAEAVRAFMVGLGVDASRVSTISYGKERPLDPRSNEAAWAKNRRGTTTIVSMGGMM